MNNAKNIVVRKNSIVIDVLLDNKALHFLLHVVPLIEKHFDGCAYQFFLVLHHFATK